MKNITRKQSLYFIFILSLIITIPICVYYYFQITSYKFEVVKKTDLTPRLIPESISYHDFDHDGSKEAIHSIYDSELGFNYFIIYSYYGELYDQFNFEGKFPVSYPYFFYDLNKDSVDELIAFDLINDSLYLNAIDIVSKSFLFKGVFVIEKPDSANNNYWDIYVHDGKFVDMNDDGEKDFVFTLKAHYAKYPRGIFVFDFKEMKVTDSFDFGAVGVLNIGDLNGDGEEEIIPSSGASGNLEKVGLHDYSAWYVPLNRKLEMLVEPIQFGDFSSSLTYYFSEKRNYAFFSKGALNKNEKGEIFEINKDFSLSKIRDISFKNFIPVKNDKSTNFVLMEGFSDKLILLDENLKLKGEIETEHPLSESDFMDEIDINFDGKEEYLVVCRNEIILYNQEFEILAKFQTEKPLTNRVDDEAFFYNSEILLSVNTSAEHYLLKLVKNPYYAIFFLLVFGGWFVLTGFLYLNYLIILYFLIYLNYFLHSFKKSNTALLILNSEGKTIYINNQTYSMLNLTKSFKRKPAVQDLFTDKKEILGTINEARTSNKPVQNSFFYSTPETQINGTVRTTPFILFKWITMGYLVEIENYTEAILLERTKIWAKSVLRIAHDIKTPLSSVSLGVQTIRNKLSGSSALNTETSEEFDGIINELNRVRNLTKSFLKFINMEVVNYQVVSATTIIDEILNKFTQFFGSKEIELVKDYGEKEGLIWADPFQLGQLFQIVLENAIDAVDGKGVISVRTSVRTGDTGGNGSLIIEFSDNGSGIAPELREKMFSPYMTTKKDGTGIGLFIAKKITEDQKGKISFVSEPGKGTVFTLEFELIGEKEFNDLR